MPRTWPERMGIRKRSLTILIKILGETSRNYCFRPPSAYRLKEKCFPCISEETYTRSNSRWKWTSQTETSVDRQRTRPKASANQESNATDKGAGQTTSLTRKKTRYSDLIANLGSIFDSKWRTKLDKWLLATDNVIICRIEFWLTGVLPKEALFLPEFEI